MELSGVIRESFALLVEKPQLFVPKLLSNVISSLIFIGVLTGSVTSFVQNNGLFGLGVFLAAMGLNMLIFVFGFLMVASMVRDNSGLKDSFMTVFHRSKTVIAAAGAMIGFTLALSLGLSLGVLSFQYFGTGGKILFVVLAFATLAALIGFSFASYFLPVTLLEERSFVKSLSTSLKGSRENSREVTILLIFSVILAGVAALSVGFLETLGYLGFVLGRLSATVVNTYLFVVSPKYYIENKG